jgi:endonuclease/exonuclease/phosphatase family metal-dependent hydrolase
MSGRAGDGELLSIGASLLLVLSLALACSSSNTARDAGTATPVRSSGAATPSPAASAANAVPVAPGETTLTLKVLSFNLLWGAGHERRFDENIPQRFRGIDRVAELREFLRQADPDVLALEEAAGWDTGTRPLVEQVAAELGMHYVLAPDAWELHVILLSKYPIVRADYVSRFQGFNGVALRATLAITPQVEVNVIAVHLNSMSSQTRSCQVEAVFDMAAELEGRTLLLGDMNFRPAADQAAALAGGGWQLLEAQAEWPIDQIWLDGSGMATVGDWWEGVIQPSRISDHFPVGVDISFTAAPAVQATAREPVSEPAALAYECPLPSEARQP